MEHVRERKWVSPVLFLLASIAGAMMFVGFAEGNRGLALVAGLGMAVLAAAGLFEGTRRVDLSPDEKSTLAEGESRRRKPTEP